MTVQAAPAPVHCSHWYAYDVGLPVHVPGFAVSVSPTTALPVIDGCTVLTGPPLAATVDVWFEFAVELPSAFAAVTTARSVRPASALRTTYVFCVAPAMFVQ